MNLMRNTLRSCQDADEGNPVTITTGTDKKASWTKNTAGKNINFNLFSIMHKKKHGIYHIKTLKYESYSKSSQRKKICNLIDHVKFQALDDISSKGIDQQSHTTQSLIPA